MGLYPDLGHHPLAALLDVGVAVTLNADNPLFTESGILEKYEAVRSAFGLSDSEMASIARTSIVASGMPTEAKAAVLDQIDRWLDGPSAAGQ